MIDTVHYKVKRPLSAAMLATIEAGNGVCRQDSWFFKISPDLDTVGTHRTIVWGEHSPTGIVVRGHNGTVELVQASLPKVLFGDNGRLIRCPEQLAEAQEKLKAILDGITTFREPGTEYVRVDLVLHFRCDIKKYIAAHRHCRHPLIRNETDEYGPLGLKLRGSEAAILFYDKRDEMKLGHGDILRVEVQLKKPKLNEIFGTGEIPLYSLDFWTCYRKYRWILCQLKPVPVANKCDVNTLLAQCEASGFKFPNGLTAMENYRATVSRDTWLTRRRQVKGQILYAAGIDWSTMLPDKNALPDDLPDVSRFADVVPA